MSILEWPKAQGRPIRISVKTLNEVGTLLNELVCELPEGQALSIKHDPNNLPLYSMGSGSPLDLDAEAKLSMFEQRVRKGLLDHYGPSSTVIRITPVGTDHDNP